MCITVECVLSIAKTVECVHSMGVGIESIHSTVQVMECVFDIQNVTQIETSMYYRAHTFIMT